MKQRRPSPSDGHLDNNASSCFSERDHASHTPTMTINDEGTTREAKVNGQIASSPNEPEPKYMGNIAKSMASAPTPPKFESKEQERVWLKFRLAQGGNLGI